MPDRSERRILLVEPFFGGSHRAFAEELKNFSRHRIKHLTLPARFWKWRMRGAAVTLSDRVRKTRFPYQAILATDMLNLAEFKALIPRDVPIFLYMHENQISYPVPKGETRDLQFGFTNITSCLAADKVGFNSRYQYEQFLRDLPEFLKMMPDFRLKDVPERIRRKARVIPLGLNLKFFDAFSRKPYAGPPVILWNHRWEFDKQPEQFFEAIEQVEQSGLDFRLIIAGENFQAMPRAFLSAKKRFVRRIIHFGFAKTREDYARLLKQADVVISTAIHETFGISVVEAAYSGAWPLLPRALSYPELIPTRYHADHLYSNFDDLVIKLKMILSNARVRRDRQKVLARVLFRFDWSRMIHRWDSLLEALVTSGQKAKKR